MLLTPLTELEAVNEMLAITGESPISSLDNITFVDAILARRLLHNTSRAVQTKGWHFNSLYDYTISPNSNGFLDVPSNVLKIDQSPSETSGVDCTSRGSRIFDKATNSFTFTKPVKFDVVQFLAFEELPEYARQYIYIRAARLFQARLLGSESMAGLTAEEENNAWVEMVHAEGEVADYTMISGNTDVGNILLR